MMNESLETVLAVCTLHKGKFVPGVKSSALFLRQNSFANTLLRAVDFELHINR